MVSRFDEHIILISHEPEENPACVGVNIRLEACDVASEFFLPYIVGILFHNMPLEWIRNPSSLMFKSLLFFRLRVVLVLRLNYLRSSRSG